MSLETILLLPVFDLPYHYICSPNTILFYINYIDMGSRTAIPLHWSRQRILTDHLDPRKNNVDQHKGTATHLLLGTGIRNDTLGHLHTEWFLFEQGELYLQVPSEDECRKKDEGVCSQCNPDERKPYYPKTPAGGGRKIHVGNYYYDYSSSEQRYFGLRDRVESYFSISPPDSDEPAIGFDMIQANGNNGVSHGTVNRWIRDVCASAGISKRERENRLNEELEPDVEKDENGEKVITRTVGEKIADHGTDNQGRPIPDVFAHDLRATFCTHLCRTQNPNYSKIMSKTGHKNEETLYKYVGFASGELNPEEDKKMF